MGAPPNPAMLASCFARLQTVATPDGSGRVGTDAWRLDQASIEVPRTLEEEEAHAH